MKDLSSVELAALPPILQLRAVSQSFGTIEVLHDLNLSVARGEFVAIVGPSGCGKTTILNLLGGHIAPTRGEVVRDGKARMVFQQDGLLPWMTARQNIELGVRHLPQGSARDNKVNELLALIGLRDFSEHYPHQLSGGMRQRVELARALVSEAEILLLDEPFGALDFLTRLRLRGELVRLLQEFPRTVILVTHDIEEAAHLAERILVLGERPARVNCELRLDAPHPRDVTDPIVVDAVRRILGEMGLRE
ncbi:bicarbonate transport ATP-binding protein CmpD [Abditibacteriota bacterium]|nr:bicarbonate transport ATP-binding protein CmpD [Abditibacteriota bacterium]